MEIMSDSKHIGGYVSSEELRMKTPGYKRWPAFWYQSFSEQLEEKARLSNKNIATASAAKQNKKLMWIRKANYICKTI